MNVILFTGHRIDAPGRPHPRFPAEAEPLARAAILAVLTEEKRTGPLTGVAGGANGGDILFLEACRELDIPFQMLLAFPEPVFIEKSVAAPEGNWVERFRALADQSKPRVLKDQREEGLWARNNRFLIGEALALKPDDFVLLALWDGQTGDGAGGTEDMVNTARQLGARFVHLDTRRLFTHIATP